MKGITTILLSPGLDPGAVVASFTDFVFNVSGTFEVLVASEFSLTGSSLFGWLGLAARADMTCWAFLAGWVDWADWRHWAGRAFLAG